MNWLISGVLRYRFSFTTTIQRLPWGGWMNGCNGFGHYHLPTLHSIMSTHSTALNLIRFFVVSGTWSAVSEVWTHNRYRKEGKTLDRSLHWQSRTFLTSTRALIWLTINTIWMPSISENPSGAHIHTYVGGVLAAVSQWRVWAAFKTDSDSRVVLVAKPLRARSPNFLSMEAWLGCVTMEKGEDEEFYFRRWREKIRRWKFDYWKQSHDSRADLIVEVWEIWDLSREKFEKFCELNRKASSFEL